MHILRFFSLTANIFQCNKRSVKKFLQIYYIEIEGKFSCLMIVIVLLLLYLLSLLTIFRKLIIIFSLGFFILYYFCHDHYNFLNKFKSFLIDKVESGCKVKTDYSTVQWGHLLFYLVSEILILTDFN
jgi:hypothetical protein